MFETPFTAVGNVITDPVLRRVGDQDFVKFRMASNSRRRTPEGSWETINTLYVTVTCWGKVATGMAAVLGGDEAEVLARLESLDLIPANRNAAGQIVAAGAVAALEKLAEDPPAKARVRVLATAGAFHTHYMAPAAEGYAAAAAQVATAEPTKTLLSNADGKPVTDAADAMTKLVAQMTRPVRWDLINETLRGMAVSALVEFPPAGTLVGIAKRELKGTPTKAIKAPEDLDGLAEL